jgi:hypothetical protein
MNNHDIENIINEITLGSDQVTLYFDKVVINTNDQILCTIGDLKQIKQQLTEKYNSVFYQELQKIVSINLEVINTPMLFVDDKIKDRFLKEVSPQKKQTIDRISKRINELDNIASSGGDDYFAFREIITSISVGIATNILYDVGKYGIKKAVTIISKRKIYRIAYRLSKNKINEYVKLINNNKEVFEREIYSDYEKLIVFSYSKLNSFQKRIIIKWITRVLARQIFIDITEKK